MELDRTLVIIVCVSFIVIWTLGKRFLGKAKRSRSGANDTAGRIESWYSTARDQLEMIDSGIRSARKAEWEALSEAEQLEVTNRFLSRYFGANANRIFTSEETLRIGAVYYEGTDPSQRE